jgi:hypothetical protein
LTPGANVQSGLQVWDKAKNEFVEVERDATAGLDMFCVLGRKLTDVVSTLTPTTHRVVSIIFATKNHVIKSS